MHLHSAAIAIVQCPCTALSPVWTPHYPHLDALALKGDVLVDLARQCMAVELQIACTLRSERSKRREGEAGGTGALLNCKLRVPCDMTAPGEREGGKEVGR